MSIRRGGALRQRAAHAWGAALTAAALAFVPAATSIHDANAYTQTDFPPEILGSPDGAPPAISMTLTSDDADGVVDPGQSFNYIATATMRAPVPGNRDTTAGASNITDYVLDFAPSPDAPLTRAPLASDFLWSDGISRAFSEAPTRDAATGTWTVRFSSGT